jgi:ribulose-phosphate 3-epimerase
MKRKINLAASLICADPLNLESEINQLVSGKTDLIHFDVMDGSFVPRYGLYPEILTYLKTKTSIPVDVHMMVDDPESYIETFKHAGADFYNVHVEACKHLHRIVKKIRDCGMKPGVALNPATPISSMEWVIKDIDMVVLMAINPGIVGHKLIPSMLDKIKLVREYANQAGNVDLIIEIDGGVTFDSAKFMIEAGADALVCGTGTIFRPQEDSIHNKLNSLRNQISNVYAI